MFVMLSFFFFFNDTATTEIYTLSLHDALPISATIALSRNLGLTVVAEGVEDDATMLELRRLGCHVAQGYGIARPLRSEEHTSELQSRQYLVCRLLLEKKKKKFHN